MVLGARAPGRVGRRRDSLMRPSAFGWAASSRSTPTRCGGRDRPERALLPVAVVEQPVGRPVAVGRVAAAGAVEAGDVLERYQDVPVQLDVRDVLDQAIGGQRAVLVLTAEEGDLDALALVLGRVVLHGRIVVDQGAWPSDSRAWRCAASFREKSLRTPRPIRNSLSEQLAPVARSRWPSAGIASHSATIDRMLPPWQTTAAVRPAFACAISANTSAVRTRNWVKLSPPGYADSSPCSHARCAWGSAAISSSRERPCQSPTSISRRRGSVCKISPHALATACAVCSARSRSLE